MEKERIKRDDQRGQFLLLPLILLVVLLFGGMVFLMLVPTEKLVLALIIIALVGIFGLIIFGAGGMRRGASGLLGVMGLPVTGLVVTGAGLGILSGLIAGNIYNGMHGEGWGILTGYKVYVNGQLYKGSGMFIGDGCEVVLYWDNVPERGDISIFFRFDENRVSPRLIWIDNQRLDGTRILATISSAYEYGVIVSARDIPLREIRLYSTGEPVRIGEVRMKWRT
jgi:hypothetical protein